MTITILPIGQVVAEVAAAVANITTEPAAPAVAAEPSWCQYGNCIADADGSTFHMSNPHAAEVASRNITADLTLIRIDDDGEQGETTINLAVTEADRMGSGIDLSPALALELAELLRGFAIRAAGPAGVEMPVERVRLGDELLTPNGWQVVEIVDVDGWCCGIPPKPGHLCHVGINTDAHDGDEQAHNYAVGDLVRVRVVQS